MALTTFSGLKSSIADWLNRSDLTNQIADFIALTEADFNAKPDIEVKPFIQKLHITVCSIKLPLN